MDSNHQRRDLLSASIGVGQHSSLGGGDADNNAEFRRQIAIFLDDMQGVVNDDQGQEAGIALESELEFNQEEVEEVEEEEDSVYEHELASINTGRGDIVMADGSELTNKPHKPNELIRFCIRMSLNAIMYPYEFARVLIQLGHEPMPSKAYKFWIFKPCLFLPGVHKYVEYIKRYDGFVGLYRGLGARLIGSTFGFLFSDCLIRLLGMRGNYRRGLKQQPHQFREFSWNLIKDSIRLATASLFSYPFYVLMVRQAAQFVGQERIYNDLRGSITQIYQTDGLFGFYAGFIPKLLGELGVLVITSTVGQICYHYLPMSKVERQYNLVIVQMLADIIMYPMDVVSTCMACSGAPLAAGAPPFMPLYGNWLDCLSDLYARGEHHRGGLLFWRTVPRYQIQTAIADGAPYIRIA